MQGQHIHAPPVAHAGPSHAGDPVAACPSLLPHTWTHHSCFVSRFPRKTSQQLPRCRETPRPSAVSWLTCLQTGEEGMSPTCPPLPTPWSDSPGLQSLHRSSPVLWPVRCKESGSQPSVANFLSFCDGAKPGSRDSSSESSNWKPRALSPQGAI